MGKKSKIVFWIIIVIAVIVRIYNFPTALKEMNTDEIMTVINAKSIVDTGKEINGISYPVYLQGWGGQSVVLLYLMALSIKIFGYSLFAIRLPSLIISIISLFVFYDLIKKLTKNENISLIGLALISISPWHILQSIWALDCNMFPHFLLIAIDLLYTGITKKRNFITYTSMIFFALCLYCYGVAIYFVPFFLLIMSIYLLKTKNIKIKELIICALIFLVFAMPIITMFAINVLKIETSIKIGFLTIPYYKNLSRTSDMIFFVPNKLDQLFKNLSSTLKVIIFQEDGAEWNSSRLFGTTYKITILFLIVGLIKSIKNIKNNKKDIANFMLFVWIAISFLTGLIVNKTNINRLNSIWYVILILAAIGIYTIYEKIKYKQIYKISIIIIYTIIFISYITYFYTYYTNVVDNSGCFSRGFYQVLDSIKSLDQQVVLYDNIKNDGCLELYIKFNNDSTKQYYSIKDEDELKEKIKNIAENEILIVNVEYKTYENINNSYQIGDFLIITQ